MKLSKNIKEDDYERIRKLYDDLALAKDRMVKEHGLKFQIIELTKMSPRTLYNVLHGHIPTVPTAERIVSACDMLSYDEKELEEALHDMKYIYGMKTKISELAWMSPTTLYNYQNGYVPSCDWAKKLINWHKLAVEAMRKEMEEKKNKLKLDRKKRTDSYMTKIEIEYWIDVWAREGQTLWEWLEENSYDSLKELLKDLKK